MRRRQERAPRQRQAGGQAEPPRGTRSVLADHGALQHEVGRNQPAVRRQQRPQQTGRNPVRRFATTRNGRPGNRIEAASACTTVMPGNRSRRTPARRGCNSTATTRAPARTRCAVRAPSPAPMSSTNSPGRTPAAAATRAAHSSASRCQPHARHDRPEAGTTDHHRVDTHAPTVARHGPGHQFVFPGLHAACGPCCRLAHARRARGRPSRGCCCCLQLVPRRSVPDRGAGTAGRKRRRLATARAGRPRALRRASRCGRRGPRTGWCRRSCRGRRAGGRPGRGSRLRCRGRRPGACRCCSSPFPL